MTWVPDCWNFRHSPPTLQASDEEFSCLVLLLLQAVNDVRHHRYAKGAIPIRSVREMRSGHAIHDEGEEDDADLSKSVFRGVDTKSATGNDKIAGVVKDIF